MRLERPQPTHHTGCDMILVNWKTMARDPGKHLATWPWGFRSTPPDRPWPQTHRRTGRGGGVDWQIPIAAWPKGLRRTSPQRPNGPAGLHLTSPRLPGLRPTFPHRPNVTWRPSSNIPTQTKCDLKAFFQHPHTGQTWYLLEKMKKCGFPFLCVAFPSYASIMREDSPNHSPPPPTPCAFLSLLF